MKNTQTSDNTNKNPPQVKCPAVIRIGTRKSALAVAQATEVKNRLLGAFPEITQDQIILVKMDTTGDQIQDRHLAEIGGKGLFTKEIEEALAAGEIDMAVHSMKDMPDTLPEGQCIECILEREDPRDAFLSTKAKSIEDLPEGAVIGTSSVRRQSQLLKIRPDLKMVQFRGNVNTRLKKLENGDVDATLLAVAGLKRIDLASKITSELSPDVMLPAVAQGAIGVECLEDNEHILRVLEVINHQDSKYRVTAERGFLKALNGSCSTPIAALADFKEDGTLHLKTMLASVDGKIAHFAEREGDAEDAEAMGIDAGKEVLSKGKELIVA